MTFLPCIFDTYDEFAFFIKHFIEKLLYYYILLYKNIFIEKLRNMNIWRLNIWGVLEITRVLQSLI